MSDSLRHGGVWLGPPVNPSENEFCYCDNCGDAFVPDEDETICDRCGYTEDDDEE